MNPFQKTRLTFSAQEKHDLLIAWVLISIAFGIVFRTDAGLSGFGILRLTILSGLTVGVGFLVHEIAHKYVAVSYGKYAEFHASIPMLILAVFMSFFGFVFAAPGAVMISGYITKREMGHIAIAGPWSNIVLAIFVLPLYIFVQGGFFGAVISYFYAINVWLALFNMIPLWVLDGAKIIAWSKKWYFITLALCIGLFVVQLYQW